MKIAVIGGGAAGFFAAINAAENYPDASVTIFEKSKHLLAKVKVSGGGRCNLTNACRSISMLCLSYPRAGKRLKKLFHVFNTEHAYKWFEDRGVPLYSQNDGRVFPQSNDSQTIVDCFLSQTTRLGITIKLGTGVRSIAQHDNGLELCFLKEDLPNGLFNKVVVATGGSPKREGLNWLEQLGHEIVDPVPSLFTFKLPNNPITELMGVAVEQTLVTIQGTKLKANGPLLITHWGISGPAVLKLSAFGARILNEMGYRFNVQVNWANEPNNEVVLDQLLEITQNDAQKKLSNIRPYGLPQRLWLFILHKCGLSDDKKWAELGRKQLNKLVNTLTNDVYHANGTTTFKEEFVTCGGVSLKSVNLNTMESKTCPNLYLAGEVLDIDGVTGGFNFQAAWTTGFIAGRLK